MTLITRFAALALAAITLAAAAVPDASSAAAPDQQRINPRDQHVAWLTKNVAGQTRSSMFYGRWLGTKAPSPVLSLHGANNGAETTTFEATTPAPNLVHAGSRGYCFTQDYRIIVGGTTPVVARYASVVVIRRQGHVVHRDAFTGDYLASTPTGGGATDSSYGPIQHRRVVRFRHFRLRRHDHITWHFSGKLSNQVDRFRSSQTVKASC